MNKKLFIIIAVAFFTAPALFIGGRQVVLAWTNPAGTPPLGGGSFVIESGSPTNTIYIKADGNVGIGLTVPTAVLHLKAGTLTAAPLKLTAGTNLTATEAGAMEFNGTHLYFTIGSTRYQIDQQGGALTPWTSAINAAGYTLNGNSTASGNLTLDSTSNAAKGYVLLNPSGGNVGIGTTTPTQAKLTVNAGTGGVAGNELQICKNGVCCPVWKDCDGDTFTFGYKDCDENCATCYVGTTASVSYADGKDQNCNGVVDEFGGSTLLFCNSAPYQYLYGNDSACLSSDSATCDTACKSAGYGAGSANCVGNNIRGSGTGFGCYSQTFWNGYESYDNRHVWRCYCGSYF